MTNTEKATPRPWSICKNGFGQPVIIVDKENHMFAAVRESLNGNVSYFDQEELNATAELIVRAVNNFDALLEACKSAYEIFKDQDHEITEILKQAIRQAEKEG